MEPSLHSFAANPRPAALRPTAMRRTTEAMFHRARACDTRLAPLTHYKKNHLCFVTGPAAVVTAI